MALIACGETDPTGASGTYVLDMEDYKAQTEVHLQKTMAQLEETMMEAFEAVAAMKGPDSPEAKKLRATLDAKLAKGKANARRKLEEGSENVALELTLHLSGAVSGVSQMPGSKRRAMGGGKWTATSDKVVIRDKGSSMELERRDGSLYLAHPRLPFPMKLTRTSD